MQCPCGSDISFEQCCFLLINKEVSAQSPEQLMRSRYSAYATKAADYIYQTYAKRSQEEQSVNEISAWAKETKWLRLIIHSASNYDQNGFVLNNNELSNNQESLKTQNNDSNFPTVCFSAYYQHQGEYFLMKETSRFIFEQSQWRYLDGKVSNSEELATPKRNELCFCHSQKKFKRCCGS